MQQGEEARVQAVELDLHCGVETEEQAGTAVSGRETPVRGGVEQGEEARVQAGESRQSSRRENPVRGHLQLGVFTVAT